jgi:hypothetical protein
MPERLSADDLARLSAAELNRRIRALSAGRGYWPKGEREQLVALQAAWREAAARETALAA